MPRAAKHALAIALLAALTAIAGCGGDDEESKNEPERAAPPASAFPKPDGQTLEEILASEAPNEELVLAPAGAAFQKGENRLGFGVFDLSRMQITDADVALYAAPASGGPAQGPYPARIESLETDPAFTAQTTAQDPDSAKVVYVSDVDFGSDGAWNLIGLIREGGTYTAARMPTVKVGRYPDIPQPGDEAPSTHTPTSDEVADISEIDTRIPASSMHDEDLADALGKEPVVLVFATPQLCVSRVCGPVVDIAEQVKAERDDEAAFIHMEIYNENSVDQGLRPQVQDYNLQTEPWVFVIDADGRVSSVFEGALSVDELNAALDKATSES